MKGYLHYISSPQAFRDPGPLWGGCKKRTVFLSVFLCCRATLTHSRTPASYRACVIPRRAAQEGFYLSTLSSVLVSSCQTVYRCDLFAATISSGGERSPIHRRHHSCRRWIVFLNLCIYIFYILYWVFSHTVWYIKCDHNAASFLPSTPTSLPKQRQSFYLHSPPQTSWGPHQLSCSHLFIYLFE